MKIFELLGSCQPKASSQSSVLKPKTIVALYGQVFSSAVGTLPSAKEVVKTHPDAVCSANPLRLLVYSIAGSWPSCSPRLRKRPSPQPVKTHQSIHPRRSDERPKGAGTGNAPRPGSQNAGRSFIADPIARSARLAPAPWETLGPSWKRIIM